MTKINPKNARIKRRYFIYLKDARGLSDHSVAAAAKALDRFETDTGGKDFATFNPEQARAFKRHLAEQRAERSGQMLSAATRYSTLTELRNFFRWLSGQTGYRSKVTASDADFFSPSEKESRIAKTSRTQDCPTVEMVRHVIGLMPASTDIEKRNRAVIAFVLLTGARDGAVASLKLKHVDTFGKRVFQDGREVRTKFSKTITTYFFPVGEDFEQIVIEWVAFLRTEKLWGNDDPLFPATDIAVGASGGFEASGLKRGFWSNADPIRRIFKDAFNAAGLPYYKPHSFRHTLMLLAESKCASIEALKAWSQNLGHQQMLTSLLNYGTLPEHHQEKLIRSMRDAA